MVKVRGPELAAMYQRLTSTSVYFTLSVPLRHVHVQYQRALFSKAMLDGCLRMSLFRIFMVRFDVCAIQYNRSVEQALHHDDATRTRHR
jgi:hypothetical protein